MSRCSLFVLQVTEATSSVAMETVDFERGLEYLLDNGISVDWVATDRSPSIHKKIWDSYPDIKHELDTWHVAKIKLHI